MFEVNCHKHNTKKFDSVPERVLLAYEIGQRLFGISHVGVFCTNGSLCSIAAPIPLFDVSTSMKRGLLESKN